MGAKAGERAKATCAGLAILTMNRQAATGSNRGALIAARRTSSAAMVSPRLSRRAASVPASKGYVTSERSNTPACSSSVAMSQLRNSTIRSRSEISVLIEPLFTAHSRFRSDRVSFPCSNDPFWRFGRYLGTVSQGHRKKLAILLTQHRVAPYTRGCFRTRSVRESFAGTGLVAPSQF
jgi:hypothetical protein